MVNLKRVFDSRQIQWDDESRELLIRLLACGSNLMEVWSIDFCGHSGSMDARNGSGVRKRPSARPPTGTTIDRHMVEVTSSGQEDTVRWTVR